MVPVAEGQDDKGKAVQSPELNLINFPPLTPIPARNRFEVVSTSRHEEHIPPGDRVKEGNAQRISKAIVPGWSILTNYKDTRNGRIWLLLDTSHFIITGIKDDAQMIHCLVKSRRCDIDCLLTVVYGYNGLEQRRALWDKLQLLSLSIEIPWLIAEDFNAVLYPSDRLSCNPVCYSEIQDFAACLQHTTLTELPWKGDYYTWSNKQPGVDRVSSRLDRVFGSYEWMMSWGHVETNYDLPQISDHAFMLLTLSSSIWTDFSQIVASMWNSHSTQGTLKSVWTRLKDLKLALKALNSRKFRGITQKIEKARIDLRVIQEQISLNCNDDLLDMEKKTLLNLEKWSLIEESVLQQKARARWIQLKDSNSKYFTAVMKDRTQTANSLPAINRSYMKNGPTLSHQQRVYLCTEVTNQDIVESIKAIGDDKAPGIDGFNAVFFKRAWDIINNQITDAIKEFFSTGNIYKETKLHYCYISS
ncbi:uncharacterized protein LOC142178376 [Nicotiana tabacum]|uniref:Uncharacterized protein LOC142178376 n=1 Tax=Nicotiana tabacum TaxID=4097 RepID=A0AC58U381_TOBAC